MCKDHRKHPRHINKWKNSAQLNVYLCTVTQSYRYLLAHSEHLLSFINRVMYNKLVVVLLFIILRYTKNVKIHFAPLVFFFLSRL